MLFLNRCPCYRFYGSKWAVHVHAAQHTHVGLFLHIWLHPLMFLSEILSLILHRRNVCLLCLSWRTNPTCLLHTDTHTHRHTHTHTHRHTHTHTHTHRIPKLYNCSFCMHACMRLCVCVCVCVCLGRRGVQYKGCGKGAVMVRCFSSLLLLLSHLQRVTEHTHAPTNTQK